MSYEDLMTVSQRRAIEIIIDKDINILERENIGFVLTAIRDNTKDETTHILLEMLLKRHEFIK